MLAPDRLPPDAASLELMPPPASMLSAVSFGLEEDADGEPVRSPFYLAECFRKRLLNWELKPSSHSHEGDGGDNRAPGNQQDIQPVPGRLASRRRGRRTNGLGSASNHCRVGLQEQLAQEDSRRIRRGKLTDAEFALLCFRPSWMQLNMDDLAALRRSRRRRVAQAKHLEWDSDAEEPIVKPRDSEDGGWGIKRYSEACVVSDLNSLPFVPQLVATCMFTVERLLPEEQMMAKVASVFPVAFRPTELRAAYPRRMLSNDFFDLVYQLIVKDVLEVCEPASQAEQEALSHFINTPAAKPGQSQSPPPPAKVSVIPATPSALSSKEDQLGTCDGTQRNLPTSGAHVDAIQSSMLENTPFPGLGPGHERRPSVMKAGGILTPAKVATLECSKAAHQHDEAATISSSASLNSTFEADISKGLASGEAWARMLATVDGKEVHLRFTSLALQRVRTCRPLGHSAF